MKGQNHEHCFTGSPAECCCGLMLDELVSEEQYDVDFEAMRVRAEKAESESQEQRARADVAEAKLRNIAKMASDSGCSCSTDAINQCWVCRFHKLL